MVIISKNLLGYCLAYLDSGNMTRSKLVSYYICNGGE